ncbi:hypothetical protein N9060_00635 [Arenicella sp.]|nr:hypothetical protein [Arenicella sp.]
MASDLNTPNPTKSLIISTFLAVILTVAVVWVYLFFRQAAYAKTHPYSVEVQLQAADSSRMDVYYDYGYGFQLAHHQTFDLISNQDQTITLTISAWKPLYAMRFDSDASFDLNRIIINKSDVTFVALDAPTKVSKDAPLSLTELKDKLTGVAR